MAKIATSLSNLFTALDRSSTTALHRQLYNQLREAILSGRLSAGTRLPSTRELACQLSLARNTVLNAFDQLYAEGYLTRRVGDGTYVSQELPDLADAFVHARSVGGHQSQTLDQAVLADFISAGHFARHLRRMRKLYAERQQVLLRAAGRELNGLLGLRPNDAGMHLIGWLPEGVDDQMAARAAFAGGVEVTPLSAYCIEPQTRGALRLGYTGYTSREIWRAVRQLAQLLMYDA